MVGKVFGIVTDAEKFYFMECSLDNQDRPSFKLSEPVVVVYNDENMEKRNNIKYCVACQEYDIDNRKKRCPNCQAPLPTLRCMSRI